MFDEEKFELPDLWPENVMVSRFYLNEAARDWLKKVDQNRLLASPQLKQRTKRRSTELKICLHNVSSVRNKTKDVNALSEVNEICFGVFNRIVDYEQLRCRFCSQALLSPRICFLQCTKG